MYIIKDELGHFKLKLQKQYTEFFVKKLWSGSGIIVATEEYQIWQDSDTDPQYDTIPITPL